MKVRDFCLRTLEQGACDAPAAAGVYVIFNKVTMRAYIGKSENIARRFDVHRSALRSGRHHNGSLQRDWLAFGEQSFVFAVFSEVDASEIHGLETALIDDSHGMPCYNWDVPQPNDRGQGRKPLVEGMETVPVNIRMTTAQRDKLKRLGGPEWVREKINKAREP